MKMSHEKSWYEMSFDERVIETFDCYDDTIAAMLDQLAFQVTRTFANDPNGRTFGRLREKMDWSWQVTELAQERAVANEWLRWTGGGERTDFSPMKPRFKGCVLVWQVARRERALRIWGQE